MSDRPLGYNASNDAIHLRKILAVSIQVDSKGLFVSAFSVAEGERQSRPYATAEAVISDLVRHSREGWELLIHQADHNMRYLIPSLEGLVNKGFEILFSMNAHQRIVYCKISRGNHRWYIRDASAMLPLDMAGLRRLAGVNDKVPEVVALIKAYHAFTATLRDTFGVRPSITIGTTALHAWQTTLEEHHIFYRQRREVEALARAGYFGGLTWLQSLADRQECTYIDINAMFAQAMRQGVPVKSPTDVGDHYYPNLPGIYSCAVYCPPSVQFAFVPMHDTRGGGAVCYPRNQWFDTVLTTPTIELARSVGYDVKVLQGFVFEQLDFPFNSFVDNCEKLELEYKDRGVGQVIKALRTSLYGKFGQRHDGKEYCLSADEKRLIMEDWTPVQTWDGGEIIDNLWERDVYIERSHMMVVWAMWITSTARNMLVRTVYALGPKECYYGNTDSILVSNRALRDHPEVIKVGLLYGEWKIKHRFVAFYPKGRNSYIGQTEGGEWVQITPGIPAGAVPIADLQRLQPHGPPVATKPYRQNHRAIDTTGGRPHYEEVVKYIVVPELDADWMHQ